MKKEQESRYCECCGKKIEMWFSNKKYCNKCSVFNKDLMLKLSSYKTRIEYWKNRCLKIENRRKLR